MLTAEEFTEIGEAESEEAQKLLCQLHDIDYQLFLRLWAIEKFGRAALEHDIIFLRVEHVFTPEAAYFCPNDDCDGPRMSHSLVITYTTPISNSISLGMLNPEYHESRIEVNWLEVTPSLEKAIMLALEPKRG